MAELFAPAIGPLDAPALRELERWLGRIGRQKSLFQLTDELKTIAAAQSTRSEPDLDLFYYAGALALRAAAEHRRLMAEASR